MNEFLIFVNEHIPEIVSYALIIVGYMLYFFVKAGAKKGANSIKTLFKEKSEMIENTDKSMRKFVDDKYEPIISMYNKLEKENNILKEKVNKQEKTLKILLEGDENGRNENQ